MAGNPQGPLSSHSPNPDALTSAPTEFRAAAEDRAEEFIALAENWKRDTKHVSLISRKILHPAYLRIIGMGQPALPFILRELRDRPGHWFVALRAIDNVDPVPAGASPEEARELWLRWGRAANLLD
jgi:hypothetical protein